jgi:hypothetical protein
MKISEIIRHLSQIQKRRGDLDVDVIKGDFNAMDDALNRNDPFPVELIIKPSGATPPDAL